MSEASEIPSDLQGQKERLRESLGLRNSIKWLKEENARKIEGIIIATVVDLIPLTGTPIENLSVRIGDDYYSEFEIAFYANNAMNGGVISYSRQFLWDIGKKMAGNHSQSNETEVELMSKTAHEMYHVREAKKFPDRYKRTNSQTLDWGRDKADLAGQLFALQYLESKKPSTQVRKGIQKLRNDINELQVYRRKQKY